MITVQLNRLDKIIVISLISAALFAADHVLVALELVQPRHGGFPLWMTVSGQIAMCYVPIKAVQDDEPGNRTAAALLAGLALIASSFRMLEIIDQYGIGPEWLHRFLLS